MDCRTGNGGAAMRYIKTVNATLHKSGLGLSRGMYMETPTGIVDGKMRYEWGKLLTYAGIGQERSSQYFDGEGFTDKTTADWFQKAMNYADNHRLWERPPGYYSIGSGARTCQACGSWFVSSRSDAKTCKSKCRKRLQRMKANVTLNS